MFPVGSNGGGEGRYGVRQSVDLLFQGCKRPLPVREDPVQFFPPGDPLFLFFDLGVKSLYGGSSFRPAAAYVCIDVVEADLRARVTQLFFDRVSERQRLALRRRTLAAQVRRGLCRVFGKLFCLFQFFFRRCILGLAGGTGMRGGAAHRAGFPRLQAFGKDAGLLIKEGLVFPAVVLFSRRTLAGSLHIPLLQRQEALFFCAVIPDGLRKIGELLSFFSGLLPFRLQLLPCLPGIGQAVQFLSEAFQGGIV